MLQNEGLGLKKADLRPFRSRKRNVSPNWNSMALDGYQLTDLPAYTKTMNDINREELDAKLSAVEARMDRRIADFQGDMRQAVSDFRLEIQPIKGMKANIWSATAVMVATIVAVVSLSFTAFDSGRETSALVQEAKQQSVETRKLLEQIQAQQKTVSTPAPVPATPPPVKPGS